MKRLSSLTAFLGALAMASTASAGGYDTPILYSARHMGMGGTAQGYVNDPSALFHNPAGLGNVDNVSLLGDFSLILGSLKSTPSSFSPTNTESETTVAPFFLVGGAFRVHDMITLGVAVYPVASAGGDYKYEIGGAGVTDGTKLVFIEAAPGIAVNLPYGINLGASYRVTYANLTREITSSATGVGKFVDLDLTGLNFASFRLGAQWTALEVESMDKAWEYRRLGVGLMYRHKTSIDLSADEGTVFGDRAKDLETTFTLPSRLVFGLRGDYGRMGGAVDVEYGFNSQNEASVISGACDAMGGCSGVDEGERLNAPSVFDWKDAITLRTGLEYRWLDEAQFATRVGYIFDGTTANKAYPTGFGTPPSPTHTVTVGCGYDGGPWQANVAYAYRTGGTEVTAGDIGSKTCPFCGKPGDYQIQMHGIYADFSYDFE